MNVDEAIHDLLNFSTDIRAVAVLGESGEVMSAAPAADAAALQAAAAGLWAAAEACAAASSGPLEHVVVQDTQGAVAMLRDGGRGIVAVTGPKPAVGLLLFDLRTCLTDSAPGEAS